MYTWHRLEQSISTQGQSGPWLGESPAEGSGLLEHGHIWPKVEQAPGTGILSGEILIPAGMKDYTNNEEQVEVVGILDLSAGTVVKYK